MRPLLRLGRAAIRHPRRMIAVWGLVVVASFIAAPVLFSSLTSDMGGGDSSESGRADERVDELVAQLPPQDRAARPGPRPTRPSRRWPSAGSITRWRPPT